MRNTLGGRGTLFAATGLVCALLISPGTGVAGDAPAASDWRLGVAAWTFRDVTFLEAIERTAGLGLNFIEAYEKQRLAPDSDVTLASDLSEADLARIRAALDKHGITLTSIYIHSIPGEPDAAAAVFSRVKKLGCGLIVGEPASRDLDVIEPLCERFAINLALHNHPTEKSEYCDPAFLAQVCRGRGSRIGACCDTGHWQRRGIDPVEGLRILEGRILSLHLKDLDTAALDGHDVPWGTGGGRVADVLVELDRQRAQPAIVAVEYEHDVGRSLPAIVRSVAFFRQAEADLARRGELRVGWATADITPDRPVALFGQMRTRISKGVRDPVTCTALAMETVRGGTSIDQVVMVSCDTCLIGPRLVKTLAKRHENIMAACPGLDPTKIILNATHSHTAPTVEENRHEISPDVMSAADYREFLADTIADVVIAAWKGRSAGETSWALGHAVVGQNRRVVYFDTATGLPAAGRTTMYGETNTVDFDSLEGPADAGVPMVFFWKPDGELTGVIINLPCPAQETEQLEEISADFWHEARIELRKRFGQDIFILPQCAAVGDCSPRILWRQVAESEMRRRRGLSGRDEIARRIADAVSDVMPHARVNATGELVLRHTVKTVALPMRLVTKDERDRCLADAEKVRADRPEKAAWHRRAAGLYDTQQAMIASGNKPTLAVGVHAVRLGDVAFVTNSFELFSDYGIRIQARSPAILTCVVQLAGYGSRGSYVPTARAVQGGGYSATVESNLVGPEAGRMLVDESVSLLDTLWSRSPASPAAD
jgi:sugar phosphate isomerase/epimerase